MKKLTSIPNPSKKSPILAVLFIIGVLFTHSMALAQTPYVEGEVIVKLKSASGSTSSYAFLGKAHSQNKMSLKQSWNKLNMHHFALKPGQSVSEAIQMLKADPDVEYVEPNYIMSKSTLNEVESVASFSDVQQMVADKNNLVTDSELGPMNVQLSVSAQSSTPIVAVIDTGLDTNHPLFSTSGALFVNTGEIPSNGIDDDGNGYVDDVNGWNFVTNSGNMYDDDNHGTHVSGIILKATGMDIFSQPFSTSPIKIMPLKFLDGNGIGSTSNAIQAIYYAVNNGAQVLNNSWGGSSYSMALHEAVIYSYNHGAAFIAAAGNNGSSNDSQPMYPASYDVPNVIAVAATTSYDTLASFSNFGFNSVNIGSPGVSIYSSVSGSSYGFMSGTSMAAPWVAGIAGVMVKEAPGMLGYQVKSIIEGTGVHVSALQGKLTTESKIDMNASVSAAQSAVVNSTQPGYSMQSGSREIASSMSATGGCGSVKKIAEESSKNSPPWQVSVLVIIMALPLMILFYMKNKSPANRRAHERFELNTSVKMKVGDQELVGSVSTISLGGAQVNTQALLEDGGIICMSIESPDGSEKVEVKGKVVWSAANKAYGVQFEGAESHVLNHISDWTRGLAKSRN